MVLNLPLSYLQQNLAVASRFFAPHLREISTSSQEKRDSTRNNFTSKLEERKA